MRFKHKLLLVMLVPLVSTIMAALIEEVYHTKAGFMFSFNILFVCTMAGAATILWEEYKLFKTPQYLKKVMMGLGAILLFSLGLAVTVIVSFGLVSGLPMVGSAFTVLVAMFAIKSEAKRIEKEDAEAKTKKRR